FDLQLADLAGELRITPEWLSKILNGHHPISYNVGLRFEDFLRRRGADPELFAREVAPNPAPATALRAKIDREYRRLLKEAGDDPAKLDRIAAHVAQLRPARVPRVAARDDTNQPTAGKSAPRASRESCAEEVSIERRPNPVGRSLLVPRQI